eukprot:SAG22_NODE_706_length_7763_cov_4.404228_11_plen_58_part_00
MSWTVNDMSGIERVNIGAEDRHERRRRDVMPGIERVNIGAAARKARESQGAGRDSNE